MPDAWRRTSSLGPQDGGIFSLFGDVASERPARPPRRGGESHVARAAVARRMFLPLIPCRRSAVTSAPGSRRRNRPELQTAKSGPVFDRLNEARSLNRQIDKATEQTSLPTSLNQPVMSATKTVGAYEAKTTLPALLAFVARGREVVITKHAKPIARLVSAHQPAAADKSVFTRIRDLHARLSLGKGESARDLIDAGRRI